MTEEVVHLSFGEVQSAAHDLASQRRHARTVYEKRSREAADAEREYRKKLAIKFTTFRSQEKGVGESEILANGDPEVYEARHARDIANGLAKAALLRIEELEADRAMLRQLGAWSQELEAVG